MPTETRRADLQVTKPPRASHDVGQNWRLRPPDQAGFLGIAWFCHFIRCLLPWEGGEGEGGLQGLREAALSGSFSGHLQRTG